MATIPIRCYLDDLDVNLMRKNIVEKKKNTQGGWALIEVLITLSLLGFLIIQFMLVIQTGFLWARTADDETRATLYAYSVIELINSNKGLYIKDSPEGLELDTELVNAVLPVADDYHISYEIQATDYSELQLMVFAVRWDHGEHEVELFTYI